MDINDLFADVIAERLLQKTMQEGWTRPGGCG